MKRIALSPARRVAVAAAGAALSVAAMVLLPLMVTLRMTVYLLLALPPMVLAAEGAPADGLLSWLAAAGLGLLLAPDKLAVLPYGLYFGWYGVLYVVLAGRMGRKPAWLVRWLCGCAALAAGLLLTRVFFPSALSAFPLWLWALAGQFILLASDLAAGWMLALYIRRLRPLVTGRRTD